MTLAQTPRTIPASRIVLMVVALVVGALLLSVVPATSASASGLDASFGPTRNIWVDRDVIRSLPTSGTAWSNLSSTARGSWGTPDIADQESNHDVATLAGALYAVRMNDTAMRAKVVQAIDAAMGTEDGGRTLALGRNLTGYVLAADIVGHRSSAFVNWLSAVRREVIDGRTLISTHEDRPNNWGTHAGAARIAAAMYLGDSAELARAATVFRGFTGDRNAYAGFKYGEDWWQHDITKPVPINPPASTRSGFAVDGALVDDVRRCLCLPSATPPKENYQWEAMQGITAQATLLYTAGYTDVWSWQQSAIHRATRFLYERAKYPAEGDDLFIPFLLDAGLGTTYSNGVTARSGKSVGFTDWTHARGVPRARMGTTATPTTTTQPPTTTTQPPTTTTQPPTTTTQPPTTTTTAPAPKPKRPTKRGTTTLRTVESEVLVKSWGSWTLTYARGDQTLRLYYEDELTGATTASRVVRLQAS